MTTIVCVINIGVILRQIKFLLVILSSILFVEFSFAAQSAEKSKQIQPREYGSDVAKSVSVLLKNGKNLKGFLGSLNGYYTAKDIRKTSRMLQAKGISQKSKIPSFKLDGSKIIFDKRNYVDFISPNLVIVNGLKVRRGKGDLHTEVNNLVERLENRQKVSFIYQLFFPKAHALDTIQGLLAAVAGGAVGALGGERYLGLNRWVGGAIGVGAVYLVTELVQSNRDGEVSCTADGYYQVRSKGRNGIFMATAEYTTVPTSTLTSLGFDYDNCTTNRAAQLESVLGGASTGTVDNSSGTSGALF